MLEALQQRPGEVERVLVAKERVRFQGRLLRVAREAGVPVSHLPAEILRGRLGARAVHQGIVAQVARWPYSEPEAVVATAAATAAGLLVVVEGVTDAGNLGAMIRSSAAAGGHGVLLSAEGTTGLSGGVVKASSGVLERIPVARIADVGERLEDLATRGFRIVALDTEGDEPWDLVPLTGRVVLVAGGEARGLRPGILRRCHHRVTIPMAAGVDSLNVGTALAVMLFEVVRRRRVGGTTP